MSNTPHWWQSGVIYQIYPRSFQDLNGDGIGDLQGIIARLDYFVWLGVDALWLSPVYPSPMVDFGYDVSDYTDIDPMFGTLADFKVLISEAHKRGLKIIMDFVPNHTSDQHPWFVESRASRTNDKRDWYIWHDGKNGGLPNNWLSEFGGPAWTRDEVSGQYYYHAYLPEQPDLNWRNPDVCAAMSDAMAFWFELGVDGFRLDTIEHLLEDEGLRDNPTNPDYAPHQPPASSLIRLHTTDHPDISAVLKRLRHVTDQYHDRVLIGETYLPMERIVTYYAHGIHLPFNFHLIGCTWSAGDIARLIQRYEALLPENAWPNWVLGNHDRIRIASYIGRAQARVAAMLLLTLRGTPTLYYGDELGLQNVAIPPEKVQDPWERNLPGLGFGRDPVRTPMPWDQTHYAGFSSTEPWLPLNEDWSTRNVAQQQQSEGALLKLYHDLIALRRQETALSCGAYGKITTKDEVLIYDRTDGHRTLRIYLNFDASVAAIKIPHPRTILLSTCPERRLGSVSGTLELGPNEGVVTILESEDENLSARSAIAPRPCPFP